MVRPSWCISVSRTSLVVSQVRKEKKDMERGFYGLNEGNRRITGGMSTEDFSFILETTHERSVRGMDD